MIKFLPCAIVLCMLMSCNNPNPTAEKKISTKDTVRFYPLPDFFKSQLVYAQAIKEPMYKITTINGKKDSAAISKDSFSKLAGIFLTKNISQVRSVYRESVFQDLSTNSYTLNYTALVSNIPIRSIDILLDEQTNNVKRVFIRSQFTKGDTSITEQCSWKAYKSFQVNRYIQAGKYNATELNYVNWNNDQPSNQ